MAIVKIIDENRTVTDRQSVAEYLMPAGFAMSIGRPRILSKRTPSRRNPESLCKGN